MIAIKPLGPLSAVELDELIAGYTSDAKYRVTMTQGDGQFSFTLALAHLPTPFVKRYEPVDATTLAHYQSLPAQGYSFGAYDGERCVGIALAEAFAWNNSLWVHELHVGETHRGRGIGQQLVAALTQAGRNASLRTIVCETQNTNVPAIRFYQRAGFQLEGVDLSYYSNDDFPDGEIALFMKKRLL